MKTHINCVATFLLIATFTTCNNNQLRERELALKEKELELRQREMQLQGGTQEGDPADTTVPAPVYEAPKPAVKYMYLVITTDEPIIGWDISERVDFENKVPPHAISKYFTYASSVITVEEYTEDRHYMEIDNYERKLRKHFLSVNQKLEPQRLRTGVDARARVVSRKSFVFNS